MALPYVTIDKSHTVTLSHCHAVTPKKNPKNAKIAYVTSEKCHTVTKSHCETEKTTNPKNVKIVKFLNDRIFLKM
jgi:hypothetical protein